MFDDALPLLAIDSNEYGWQLFQQATSGIYQVKEQTEPSLPINKKEFKAWQDKDQLHHTPLFILAYALNLVDDPERIDLTGGKVIKGLVARETKRLKQEATDNSLDGRSLIMLKALAGISGDLSKQQIKKMAEITKLDWLAPDNLETLSIWQPASTNEAGEQQAGCFPRMQPDLLAAALLAEVLATEEQSGLLQFAALKVAENMATASSQLGRLMHDACQVIGIPWPQHSLIEYIGDDVEKCKSLDTGLSRDNLELTLLPLSLAISTILVEHESDPIKKARSLNNLSNRLAESGDRAAAKQHLKRAIEMITPFAKKGTLYEDWLETMQQSLKSLD